MKNLRQIVGDKDYFVATTNGDTHLELSGFDQAKVFEIENTFERVADGLSVDNKSRQLQEFLSKYSGKKIAIIELGIGRKMSTYTEIQPYLPAETSSELRSDYHRWCNFLDNYIVFNHSISEIMPDNDKAKEILAHASLFHDTCRFDDGLDVGHGARAAIHYKDYCERNGLSYHPEAALVMKYHDIDDMRGKVGIRKEYRDALPCMLKLYDIFKDTDALDRFRLGPGGLDPKYLRTQASVRMMPLAEELVATTF